MTNLVCHKNSNGLYKAVLRVPSNQVRARDAQVLYETARRAFHPAEFASFSCDFKGEETEFSLEFNRFLSNCAEILGCFATILAPFGVEAIDVRKVH